MKLKNPFPLKVKKLYLNVWECVECKQNGTDRGGLELHHIKGRESNSALNCAMLCGVCHSCKNHNQEEEQKLMIYQIRFLLRNKYEFSKCDLRFYAKHKKIYDNYDKREGI